MTKVWILRSDGQWVGTGWASFEHLRNTYSSSRIFQKADTAFDYLIIGSDNGAVNFYRQPIIKTITFTEAEERLGVQIRD